VDLSVLDFLEIQLKIKDVICFHVQLIVPGINGPTGHHVLCPVELVFNIETELQILNCSVELHVLETQVKLKIVILKIVQLIVLGINGQIGLHVPCHVLMVLNTETEPLMPNNLVVLLVLECLMRLKDVICSHAQLIVPGINGEIGQHVQLPVMMEF